MPRVVYPMFRRTAVSFARLSLAFAIVSAFAAPLAQAQPKLIARGSIAGTALDASGLTGALENGTAANLPGGLGSGLAWAGLAATPFWPCLIVARTQ